MANLELNAAKNKLTQQYDNDDGKNLQKKNIKELYLGYHS